MPTKKSLGDKLDQQYEKVKEGLQDVGRLLTEEDDSPRVGLIPGPQRPTAASARLTGLRSESRNRTKEQLYADAKRLGIKGRSKMTKAELARAVGER
jgi:hypothetical protein